MCSVRVVGCVGGWEFVRGVGRGTRVMWGVEAGRARVGCQGAGGLGE